MDASTLRDVELGYGGEPVVDGLDLDVAPGEILVLTGPSGCGKSTVLRALAGLLPPDGGEVLADGTRVTTTSRDRAMVFQDNALLPWRTVQSNVELALRLAGRPANRAAATRPSTLDRRRRPDRLRETTCRRACPAACANAYNSPAAWPVHPGR